jgi:hypothetical protein
MQAAERERLVRLEAFEHRKRLGSDQRATLPSGRTAPARLAPTDASARFIFTQQLAGLHRLGFLNQLQSRCQPWTKPSIAAKIDPVRIANLPSTTIQFLACRYRAITLRRLLAPDLEDATIGSKCMQMPYPMSLETNCSRIAVGYNRIFPDRPIPLALWTGSPVPSIADVPPISCPRKPNNRRAC